MVKSETKTTERAQWGREKVPRRGERDVEEGDGEYYGKSKRGFVLGRKKEKQSQEWAPWQRSRVGTTAVVKLLSADESGPSSIHAAPGSSLELGGFPPLSQCVCTLYPPLPTFPLLIDERSLSKTVFSSTAICCRPPAATAPPRLR